MGEGLPTFLSRVPFAFCLNSPIHYAHIFLSLKLFHPFEKTARFAQAYSCRRTGWASGETDGHQGTGAPFLHGSLMSPTIQIPILMAVSAEVHRQPSSRSAVEISARNAECKAHREASSYHVFGFVACSDLTRRLSVVRIKELLNQCPLEDVRQHQMLDQEMDKRGLESAPNVADFPTLLITNIRALKCHLLLVSFGE